MGNLPTTQNLKSPIGLEGNLFTIKLIQKYAHQRKIHPAVRNLALFIITKGGVKAHDYINEARAIGHFVQQHCHYMPDINGVEQLHDPVTLIDQIKNRGVAYGDCDDYTLLIASLLLSIGQRPYACCVRYKSANKKDNFNHIYPVVYAKSLKNKRPTRLSIDVIKDDVPIGYEPNFKSKEEFKI